MSEREWNYCPTCSGSLDTGWECNECGRDWMPYGYPWWRRLLDRIKWWKP